MIDTLQEAEEYLSSVLDALRQKPYLELTDIGMPESEDSASLVVWVNEDTRLYVTVHLPQYRLGRTARFVVSLGRTCPKSFFSWELEEFPDPQKVCEIVAFFLAGPTP